MIYLFLIEPGPPRDVKFMRITYGEVHLQWNIPVRPNGLITGYKVEYKHVKKGSAWKTHIGQVQPFQRTASVQGLVYNAYYDFKITGRTGAGWGEPAVEQVLVTMNRSK